MKQNLNEQIARIKQLLAINESFDVTETETILNEQFFAKVLQKMGSAFETKFVTSIEGKLGKRIATATDAEIGAALKSLPVLRQEIAAAVYTAEKSMIDGVFSKYDMSIAGDALAAYKELQVKGLNKNIIKDVTSEWKTAGKGGTTTSTGTNNALKPNNTPAAPPVKTGVLPPNADDIIQATAKSSPEAAAYMAQVESLGFNEKVTKLIQLEYGKPGVANKTAAELIDLGNQLVNQLSEKEYGWLRRIWSSVSKDPAASISKAGKAGTKLIFWYSAIALTLAGAGIAIALKSWVESKTGTSGRDLLPSIPDSNKTSTKDKSGSGYNPN
jgi:hypothetical protein